jgi:hypothetical protein
MAGVSVARGRSNQGKWVANVQRNEPPGALVNSDILVEHQWHLLGFLVPAAHVHLACARHTQPSWHCSGGGSWPREVWRRSYADALGGRKGQAPCRRARYKQLGVQQRAAGSSTV